MTKPRAITISRPFDARHVTGASVPGVTVPVATNSRSSMGLEPDEAPSHTFAATGNVEIPRRSNTISSTLRQPSLRLKTSLSLLRNRSISGSQDTSQMHSDSPNQGKETSTQGEQPPMSLRKKSSSARLWQRSRHDSPIPKPIARPARPENISSLDRSDSVQPTLRVKTSMVQIAPQPTAASSHNATQNRTTTSLQKNSQNKQLPPVRPKRADSGTAIDFDDVPLNERPLGFWEIAAVSSFAERMVLYKKAREYWAHADHGLDEWVERTSERRPLRFRV